MKVFMRTKWLVIFLVILALFLRFYNYQNRWTLNQDQARDAIIANYSISSFVVPLVGPPSSAGNFSFGPLYYWVIICFTFFLPIVNGSWIGFTLLSVASVTAMCLLGKKMGGLMYGFILGLIWAVSTANIFHAPDMLNPMVIGIMVVGVFYSLFQILENNSKKYALFLGFCIGAAINFHFQSLGLILLLGAGFISRNKFKNTLLIILGFLVSFAPIIYFDLKNNFVWSLGVINYFISGQNKFNINYNLLDDVFNFWPGLWGEVVAGIPEVGYLIIALLIIAIFISYRSKSNFNKTFLIIFITFLLQIIILNFYKGTRSTVYLLVYHPFILFLTGWSLWVLWKKYNYLGYVLIVGIAFLSLYSDLKIINSSTQTLEIYNLKQKIDKLVPEEKHIYSYQNSNTVSLPLFYLWLKEGKISTSGVKVGICKSIVQRDPESLNYIENCQDSPDLMLKDGEYKVFDLSHTNEKYLGELDELSSQKIYGWLYERYNLK